jgi:hypothetical protein
MTHHRDRDQRIVYNEKKEFLDTARIVDREEKKKVVA